MKLVNKLAINEAAILANRLALDEIYPSPDPIETRVTFRLLGLI